MWAGLGPAVTLALVLVAWATQLKPTAPPIFTGRPFVVAWDVPTQDCGPRLKVPLDLKSFDVQASPNEGFVNQNITIFYHDRLGLYPRFNSMGRSVHGGVPQNGSLWAHLKMLQEHVEHYIRTQEPAGLAVIDWEDWRPVWVRNWQDKDIYRQSSRQLVAVRHPDWPADRVVKQAQYEFEFAARQFMLETLRFVKAVRPRHLWGFYLFPDCYNHDYVQNWDTYTGRCPDVEVSRNDQLAWLWAESTALFPSVYLDETLASSTHGRNFVSFRVQEAIRVAHTHHANHALPVYVFTRPTYSRRLTGLSEMDLISTIGESAALGAAGVILWGDAGYTTSTDELEHSLGESAAQGAAGVVLWVSWENTKTKESCQAIKEYVDTTLGPFLLNVTSGALLCSQALCSGHGRCARRPSHPEALLILNPTSFSIQLTRGGGPLTLQGALSLEDRMRMAVEFQCRCYHGWKGAQCEQRGMW
uniref:Hyaluronidase n=1 Tax=Ailuropoda melanoleuca TaxID=9646 RepID=A0A7N5K580_AILME